ncbi:DUF5689 domain-containing protein [Alistipes sp.]|uniref:DUF5689 domain-containing protein n=1 Tax=Alistipes sp. TaxID=1872444 RepID=UPI003AEFEDFA
MNRLFKISLIAAAGLFFVGCYNDFSNPKPAKIYTQKELENEGAEYVSIRDLKEQFKQRNPGMIEGSVASWTVEGNIFTGGKVISSDRYGSIYKSIYIYDEESGSAIEVKLNTGNYLFYPVGRQVFIKLKGLVLGNYRGMVSIGTRSANTSYSNDNIENFIMIEEHVKVGEQIGMTKADTLVVTRENYLTTLSDDDLGRLVRFEGVQSKFGTAGWGYKNTFPNYFANSTYNFDTSDPGWENVDTWATKRKMPNLNTGGEGEIDYFFYGSAWFTYGDVNATPGNYVVRTSGYAQFREKKIPADGKLVDLTAIYTKYTGPNGQNPAYQLILISDADVKVLP